jgi:hypothetical protein
MIRGVGEREHMRRGSLDFSGMVGVRSARFQEGFLTN